MATRRLLLDLTPLRRSRDFRYLMGGQCVSLLGTQLTTVAVPFQVYLLTRSSLDVGLASLTQLAPLLLCSLLGGPVIPECPEGVLYFTEAGWHNDDGSVQG